VTGVTLDRIMHTVIPSSVLWPDRSPAELCELRATRTLGRSYRARAPRAPRAPRDPALKKLRRKRLPTALEAIRASLSPEQFTTLLKLQGYTE